jgi:hypothetical protein
MADWLRLWHGTVSDTKFLWVERKSGARFGDVMTVWLALLEEASQADDRGDVSGFDAESFDFRLGDEEGLTLRILRAMSAKGLITEDMRLAGWDRRQPVREDSGNPETGAMSSTERSRLHRQRRKAQEEDDTQRDATQCNDTQRDATRATSRVDESRGEEISPSPPTAREGEFPMDLSWEPSDHFLTLARQAGAPAPTAEAVAEFRSYWIGQGAAMTQHAWDHKLLTNLKAQKLRGGQSPPGRANARASPGQPRTLSEGRAAAAKAIFNPGPAGQDDGHERRTIDVTPAPSAGLGAKALR